VHAACRYADARARKQSRRRAAVTSHTASHRCKVATARRASRASAESPCRCYRGEPGPGADVGRGEPSPGADVAIRGSPCGIDGSVRTRHGGVEVVAGHAVLDRGDGDRVLHARQHGQCCKPSQSCNSALLRAPRRRLFGGIPPDRAHAPAASRGGGECALGGRSSHTALVLCAPASAGCMCISGPFPHVARRTARRAAARGALVRPV
jgi:hypothetical protein